MTGIGLRGRDRVRRQVRPLVARRRLVRQLRELGVRPGQTLLVHASLRSVGWVDGGAPTLVAALRQAVGLTGTVVVPTATEENSMTSRAHRARIAAMTPDEVKAYRDDMPGFDKDSTPSGMGALAEALRTSEGAVRSDHPQSSLAAIGPEAEYLMADHRLDCHYGEYSPLAKLYKLDARVLMIGVGYQACTAFHLAEYRYTPNPPWRTYACVVIQNGKRRWTSYQDAVLDDREFEFIGESLESEADVRRCDVGNAKCRLLSFCDAVDFATDWLAVNRR
jgi:aminoglycoside 3-N-acetyltransferase